MSNPTRRWYRSLYWRIALGFIVLLAVMLVVQAASFVWLAVQTEQGQSESVGQDFAELVAAEFESAIERDPSIDLKAYAATKHVLEREELKDGSAKSFYVCGCGTPVEVIWVQSQSGDWTFTW